MIPVPLTEKDVIILLWQRRIFPGEDANGARDSDALK